MEIEGKTIRRREKEERFYKIAVHNMFIFGVERFIKEPYFIGLKHESFALLHQIGQVPSQMRPCHISVLGDIFPCECSICAEHMDFNSGEIMALYNESVLQVERKLRTTEPSNIINGYIEFLASISFRRKGEIPYIFIFSKDSKTLVKTLSIRISLEYIRYLAYHTETFFLPQRLLKLIEYYKSKFKKRSCSKTVAVAGRIERHTRYVVFPTGPVPLLSSPRFKQRGHCTRVHGTWVSDFKLFSVNDIFVTIEVNHNTFTGSSIKIQIPTLYFGFLSTVKIPLPILKE